MKKQIINAGNFFLIFICLIFFSFNAHSQLRADGFMGSEKTESENQAGAVQKVTNTVVCPVLAGITCTMSGPSASTYLGAPAGCNAGSFAGSNPWDGGSSAGYVRWEFSTPIKGVTLKAGSVNNNDYATHTISGGTGGTNTISGLVCLSSLSGMTIGVFTGSCCGDVAWTLTSTGTFTRVNLANTGGASGWIAECPSFMTVLPIELVSFDGVCTNRETIDLKWKTISEINNDHFLIERSRDAQKWEAIGKINGAGNSTTLLTYSFTDTRPLRGIIYYRLKQTDKDGSFEYSPLAVVENCRENSDVTFFPNPVIDELQIKNNSDDKTKVDILDPFGNIVISHECEAGESRINFSELNNGVYFIRLSENAKPMKLMVQH